jgi:predicted DNA-binding transcriptional regulator AlpA
MVSREVSDTALDAARLLSVKEVADLLCMSIRSVWRFASAGQLPAPIRIGGGRCVRWQFSELKAFIARKGEAAL